jgi:two-component system, OmpR family, sensor kinase
MIGRHIWQNSIKNRLTFLFFSITACAIVVIYFYVVPQLESNLTSQKLDALKEDAATYIRPLQRASASEVRRPQLDALTRTLSEESGTRVTLLGLPFDRQGPDRVGGSPPYVISDSQDVDTSREPSNNLVLAAARSKRVATGTRAQDGSALAQVARPIVTRGVPSWVVVFSEPLDDVQSNVALIKRQILIAGVIALIVAMASGYYAASVLARRVKRLEQGARDIAAGDFSRPIPIDSQDELGQLALAFNEMQRKLARFDNARREFIANASHELRTPIFSLGGFMELLQDEELDEPTRAEFIATMRGQVDRLQKLATDLLDLSRLDAGSLDFEREPVPLRALANQIAYEFSAAAQSTHTLEVAGADSARDIEAICDPQRVGQILRILLDNALTHTPPGTRVSVRVGADAVERPAVARLEVADDGPGIERRELPHVFERFHTGNSGRGSGLGLAIARELAQGMNGRLDVESRRGETVFSLSLPFARERPVTAQERDEALPAVSASTRTPA